MFLNQIQLDYSSFSPFIVAEVSDSARNNLSMLTEIYIEAILTDFKRADDVWELWNAGLIPDELAEIAWLLIHSRQGQC